MRPLLYGDLSAAARVLLHRPRGSRPRLARQMLAEAEIADLDRRSTGRLHPRFGNGSLMGAARMRVLADEPGFDNPDFCACFLTVLRAVMARRVNLPHS